MTGRRMERLSWLGSGWRYCMVVFAVWHCCELCPGTVLAQDQFLAGAAVADVTPAEPVPMWGYGSRHAALSQGVQERLQANVVVLQAGKDRLAIVGLDLGRSPSEESLQRIRTRLQEQHGIANSFIAGSHTHHGPVLELSDRENRGKGRFDAALRYYQQLENGIVDAAGRAVAGLRPAKLAAGGVELENFNRNRHSKQQPAPLDAL